MVAIMCTIIYVQKTLLKVYIDGVSANLQEGIILNRRKRQNICRYKRNCKILRDMMHIMENIKLIQKIQINVG